MTAQQSTGWHVHPWGTWGWLETGVKAIGIIVGIIAFFQVNTAALAELTGLTTFASVVLISLLTLLTVGVLGIRLRQREIISVIFAAANLIGHAGMWFYMTRQPDSGTLPVIFGLAYVIGELVKQRFLAVTGYTESGAQPAQMVLFSRGLMVVYAIFVVLVLL